MLESLFLGRDTIAVLPTGYGKSVIFHLLPFTFNYRIAKSKNARIKNKSIVLVIAPLNALIEDQLSILKRHGIKGIVLSTAGALGVGTTSDEDVMSSTDNDSDTDNTGEGNNLQLTSLTKKNAKEDKYQFVFAHPEAFISSQQGRQLLTNFRNMLLLVWLTRDI